MIKNKIILFGSLILLSALTDRKASVVGVQQSGVRDQVTKWFDEKKYLQNELSYERGYGQLQEVVKGLLAAIKQKYSAISASMPVPAVTKDSKLVADYMSGRYIKNIREGK